MNKKIINVVNDNKYYGTDIMIYGKLNERLRELGYKGTHNQFRVICKATSMAEANRILKDYGFGEKSFIKKYTSETGNDKEIELCDKYGVIIRVDMYEDNYVDIRNVVMD